MHDPLAATAALNDFYDYQADCPIHPANVISVWKEVELFREGGGWGSSLKEGTKKWISVDYDRRAFIAALLEGC